MSGAGDGRQEIALHGHRVAYRRTGAGPSLLLLHGITSDSSTWLPVLDALAEHHEVIAPDLIGHGGSAKPRGDYSLGAYASGVRDLLAALGIPRVTVVGHSLGGGVAMQFSYQYPEFVERLVLVDSGGLGRTVSPLLRAATLPGAELVLPLLTHRSVLAGAGAVGRLLGRAGIHLGTDLIEAGRGHASLADPEARGAFLSTLRAIVDAGGQRVDARDRLYLAESLPTMVVWGERDHIIPLGHGLSAHALMPGSRLVTFPRAGHYPHVDEPEGFVDALSTFVAETSPGEADPDRMRQLLLQGPGERSAPARAYS